MRRCILFLIAVLTALGLCVTATAHEVPDLTQNGAVTFTMTWDGAPLSGGSLTLYKVGEVVESDGDYSFALTDALGGYDLTLEDPDDPALAAELARIAGAEGLTGITAPVSGGEVRFADVAPGLYVVVQAEGDATEGFAPISPFLISMPKYENGAYVTDVTATPKVPLVTEPTEPEATEPPDPQLPQTGQLNWPIPVLLVSGLALFMLGWYLRRGGRKEVNEA